MATDPTEIIRDDSEEPGNRNRMGQDSRPYYTVGMVVDRMERTERYRSVETLDLNGDHRLDETEMDRAVRLAVGVMSESERAMLQYMTIVPDTTLDNLDYQYLDVHDAVISAVRDIAAMQDPTIQVEGDDTRAIHILRIAQETVNQR